VGQATVTVGVSALVKGKESGDDDLIFCDCRFLEIRSGACHRGGFCGSSSYLYSCCGSYSVSVCCFSSNGHHARRETRRFYASFCGPASCLACHADFLNDSDCASVCVPALRRSSSSPVCAGHGSWVFGPGRRCLTEKWTAGAWWWWIECVVSRAQVTAQSIQNVTLI